MGKWRDRCQDVRMHAGGKEVDRMGSVVRNEGLSKEAKRPVAKTPFWFAVFPGVVRVAYLRASREVTWLQWE